jgi:hypothetical protein
MQLSQGIMTNMWNMPHDAFRVPVQPSTDAEDVKAFLGKLLLETRGVQVGMV